MLSIAFIEIKHSEQKKENWIKKYSLWFMECDAVVVEIVKSISHAINLSNWDRSSEGMNQCKNERKHTQKVEWSSRVGRNLIPWA